MVMGRFVVLCALAGALSCSSHSSKLDQIADTPHPSMAAGSDAWSNAAAPKREPVTATKLEPIIHELGLEHAVP
jgi:hypothetical protein